MAHYRFDVTWHTLGTVPRSEPLPPTIGDQLADALEDAGVSQKELARRLAAIAAGTTESKRRWILKLLNDDVTRPNMAEVEAALNLPAGHFVVPTLEETKRRRVRLEELEAQVADLEAAAEAITPYLVEIADRLSALERRASPSRQESGNGAS